MELYLILLSSWLWADISFSAADVDPTVNCKIWTTCNSDNTSCTCGNTIDSAVFCSDGNLLIQPCYCMYYDQALDLAVVGNCMLTCYYVHAGNKGNFHFPIEQYSEENATAFNDQICSAMVSYRDTHREGRFCGRCKEGYGLAVYSYHYTSCIPCTDYGYKNWLRYFAVALLPLTLFYFLVVVFRINITSSRLNGAVFVLQCMGSPLQTRIVDGYLSTVSTGIYQYPKKYQALIGIPIVTSFLGIVNLDFFRLVYPYFCLHPKLNSLHVISLDFIVALYPFLLIFLTYLLVTLYDKNYLFVVVMWKPFKYLLRRYQREFDLKSSLIEIFASFILLSNVKILGICFDLLAATRSYDVNGKKLNSYWYYDANIEYFSAEHLPFAILALLTGFVFVALPFLLLISYPSRLFQRCLNCFGFRCLGLHVFMDAFQGSYRTEPHDLRYFSAYYMMLRFLLLFLMEYFASTFHVAAMGVVVIVGTLIFAAFQPYKQSSHNRLDIVSMLFLALFYVGYTADVVASYLDLHWLPVAQVFFVGSVAAMTFFFVGLLTFHKIKTLISKCVLLIRQRRDPPGLIEVFDRHSDYGGESQHTPLLRSVALQ